MIATIGQRVNPGTPVLEVISNAPEVLVDLESEIADSLNIGDTIRVEVDKKFFTGSIIAMSKAAGANLLYTTRISVPEAKGMIGNAANLIFTASREISDSSGKEKIVLPLRAVKIVSEQEGQISILGTGNTLIYKSVKLGKVV